MTWSWLAWWRRPRPGRRGGADVAGPNGGARARLVQERKLAEARRQTPQIEQAAESLAELPPDELAARMRAAFGILGRT